MTQQQQTFSYGEKMKKLYVLSAILALSASTAQASEGFHPGGRFGLGIGGGIPIPVNYARFNNTTDSGWMAQGHMNYYFTDGLGVEALYQHYHYRTGNPLNNLYTLGLNWRIVPGGIITPVIGVAAGWGSSTPKAGLDTETNGLLATAKFGVDMAVTHNFVVGLAAKYNWLFSKNDGGSDQQAIVPELNFTFFLGSNADESNDVKPAPMAAAPVDGDDDQDGVRNSVDKCPGTPTGAKVNSFGCQENEAVNERVNIEFASGKSVIPADYTAEADKIVELMKNHQDVTAEIQGYTDNTGKKANNLKLSQARAKSVRMYIVSNGVDGSRVTAKGYGDADPVADNATAEGRKENRRVVAKMTSAKK